MFSWCLFLFSCLVYAWLVRGAPSTSTERTAFSAIGGVLLALALVSLLGLVTHG